MRVLVCGGRDYRNARHLYKVLDGLSPKPSIIIHGDYSALTNWPNDGRTCAMWVKRLSPPTGRCTAARPDRCATPK